MTNKFQELGLGENIVKAITDLGFETPTPVQEKTIPMLLEGSHDLVSLAQTGTGKTAAFGLPLLSLIDLNSKATQALILCPTRELCMQITRDITNYAKYMGNVHIVAIYGGASMSTQISQMRNGAQIIVGTPGRMIDMIERGKIKLASIKYVVLDEADEMLNMGFKEDLDTILNETPEEKNTWLFSATMPDEVQRISRNYMNKPVEITQGTKNQGNENIEHIYYVVHAKDKYLALKRIADFNPDIFAIVFCRTKIETQEVADALIKDGYNADALHGDLSQAQRDHVMKRYRSRSLQMLVATDVAARGIDVNDVTHVINYNLPDEIENYTHRSGRTARAGKTGVSIVIINMKEVGKIKMLERIVKKKFTRMPVPGGFEVCENQLFSLVKKLHNVEVNEEAIAAYLPKVYEELTDLDREEIIKRFVSIEFNRFLEYYKSTRDLNADANRDPRQSQNPGAVKLFMNVGDMDGFDKNKLREFISEVAAVGTDSITWVDVKRTFSFVEVKTEVVETVTAAFNDIRYKGRPVRIESRGNRDEDVPRQRNRYRGGEGGGGYKGGDGGGYKGNSEGGGYKGGKSYGRSSDSSYNKGGGRGGDRNRSYGGGGGSREKRKW